MVPTNEDRWCFDYPIILDSSLVVIVCALILRQKCILKLRSMSKHISNEAVHEKRTKTPTNFFVTVGTKI
jgi:hypothetical protein